jgi:P22 tail accessory factor.
MATASQIIRRALRLIGAIDASEALSASDAQDALETLNAMLAEWHEAEIGLPDYSLSSITDELASDAADREAIAYQLALRVSPEYGLPITRDVAEMAQSAMARMRLRYFQPGKADLTELPRICRPFNITTGDY